MKLIDKLHDQYPKEYLHLYHLHPVKFKEKSGTSTDERHPCPIDDTDKEERKEKILINLFWPMSTRE